jgi:hypothetical protein
MLQLALLHTVAPRPQDEEFLYLVMEYLPGGDVMVSHAVTWG